MRRKERASWTGSHLRTFGSGDQLRIQPQLIMVQLFLDEAAGSPA